MKKMILALTLLGSVAQAASIEEARALFLQRDNSSEGVSKARQAAAMVSELAKDGALSNEAKAELKLEEASMLYFLGNREKSEKATLKTFEAGYEAADFAQKYLDGKQKAEALYWYAAAQGRWGETKGILSSLSRWKKEMKPALQAAMKIDPTVHEHGIYRIIGKAFMKVPGESKSKGLNYLTKAYEETLTTIEVDGEEIETSTQINNTLFLMFALEKREADVDMFCELYDSTTILLDGGVDAWKTLSPESWSDIELEIKKFEDGEGDYKKLEDYYDDEC